MIHPLISQYLPLIEPKIYLCPFCKKNLHKNYYSNHLFCDASDHPCRAQLLIQTKEQTDDSLLVRARFYLDINCSLDRIRIDAETESIQVDNLSFNPKNYHTTLTLSADFDFFNLVSLKQKINLYRTFE